MGRQHTAEMATENFRQLREGGFSNLNIDLIFGLPHQTRESWQENLEKAVALEPDHLSVYQLTYEEDTPFFESLQKGFFKPNEELRGEMFEITQSFLERYGYDRYEVSNYARPGFESIHNQAYWELRNYRGFGPSAVSTIEGDRFTNIANTDLYIEELTQSGKCTRSVEKLSAETLWREGVMLGLRTRQGVDQSHFEKKPVSMEVCLSLQNEGLLIRNQDRWILTPRGLLVADTVAAEFFSD